MSCRSSSSRLDQLRASKNMQLNIYAPHGDHEDPSSDYNGRVVCR